MPHILSIIFQHLCIQSFEKKKEKLFKLPYTTDKHQPLKTASKAIVSLVTHINIAQNHIKYTTLHTTSLVKNIIEELCTENVENYERLQE